MKNIHRMIVTVLSVVAANVLVLLLCPPSAHAQEVTSLESGKMIEREIAGGQTHLYQISVPAGQFMRVMIEPKAIDVAVILTAPNNQQVRAAEVRTGIPQSFSAEAEAGGNYRLSAQGLGARTRTGSFQLRLEISAPTVQTQQRLKAERWLAEATPLAARVTTAQQAVEGLEQALAVWRALGDRAEAANTLHLLGQAHARLSRREKAIEYYEQALTVYRELKNRVGEGIVLIAMGDSYNLLSRYEKAIEQGEMALVIAREVKDRDDESAALNTLADAHNFLGHHEKAIEYLTQALAIARAMENQSSAANALSSLGNAAGGLRRYEQVIEYNEQALALYRELKNRTSEANALSNLGIANNLLNRDAQAVGYYEQALAIHRELKNRTGEGIVLNNLGNAWSRLGRDEKAIEYLEQALIIAREVKRRVGEGNTLLALGNVHSRLGRHEQAVEYYQQALVIQQEVKNRAGAVSTLLNLSNEYNKLGRYENAIEQLTQALTLARELKDTGSESALLSNLGNAWVHLGGYEKGIAYYDQALALARDAKDRHRETIALNALGNVYDKQEQPEKAIAYLEQGLTIARELKRPTSESHALNSLGNIQSKLGHHEKAVEYYTQALQIARAANYRAGEALSLINLGDAQNKLGRPEKAGEYSEQALLVAHAMKDPEAEMLALNGLAKAERDRGNLVRARSLSEECLRLIEAQRAGMYNQEARASYFATAQSARQFYLDLLMRLHKANPDGGFDALAVEANERARARGLLELLTEAGANIRQDVDAALLARERTLATQLNARAAAQIQLLSRPHTPEQINALKQEISQLENDYDQVQAQIRRVSPRYAALVQPQPLKLAQIQQQLDDGVLLLEYALGEEHSYLWAITKETLTSYELPKGEQIKQRALQVYEMLTARSTRKQGESALQRQERITQAATKLPAAAQALSQMLLAPVAAQLGNKRLVIVADGALQYIPFGMLPEPVVGGRWSVVGKNQPPATSHQPLIVKHEVIHLPSASALAIQRAEFAGRTPAPKMLAVIADPVFDRTDVRFKTVATEASDKAQPPPLAFNDARSIEHFGKKSDEKSGLMTGRFVIPRLPFTRQEATRLLALTPPQASFGAMDFQASRATVLKGDLSQYRYVHIATHGWLDSERPGLSSLVLSMVNAQGQTQDGFLRANDIYNLKLPAELVVLSACQTGLGKEIKGEGLVGLTRGFMYAGAARVVVSLWSVNDKATAELMTVFYRQMLKDRMRPAAALRAAQIEMWRQKQWQAPYYWAAFVLQGEWR